MKKLIIAGFVCIFLLVVICTAGCVGSSDPIVGTWGYEKNTLDLYKTEPFMYYVMLPNNVSVDSYTFSSTYRLVFEPDGTGKEYYEDFTDVVSEFVWERCSDESYKVHIIGQNNYIYYNLYKNDPILYNADTGSKYQKY